MAMSTGGNSGGPMSEINVTPLVDVMLVLLIIFMITAPLLTHRFTVELPHANPKKTDTAKVEPMDLAVKPDGSICNDANTSTALKEKSPMLPMGVLTTNSVPVPADIT